MKIAIPVDTKRLQVEIDLAEAKQTFPTQMALFEHIANTDWAKTTYKKPLTAAVLYSRYKQDGLILKTVKGKRGRAANSGNESSTTNVVNRTPRGDKVKANPRFKEVIASLKKDLPGQDKLISRVAQGSLPAIIRAHCLCCCGGSRQVAKECKVYSCPIYLVSPFVNIKNNTNAEDVEEDNDEE